MVKVSKSNSTVEMCGKVYRLAPVTLTDELQTVHQKRRSRAYQWKRPTVFLKEGDPIPPDVDPDTVRWIPANHPFATTASEIDEDLAQTNVHQKHGVPFRIKAEHEALQRKLEALQNVSFFSSFHSPRKECRACDCNFHGLCVSVCVHTRFKSHHVIMNMIRSIISVGFIPICYIVSILVKCHQLNTKVHAFFSRNILIWVKCMIISLNMINFPNHLIFTS